MAAIGAARRPGQVLVRVAARLDAAFAGDCSGVAAEGGKLDGSAVVIWTTTPWTIPGNRALAYGPDIAYALVDPRIKY